MPTAALIYPHQLFDPHPAVAGVDAVFLVENPLAEAFLTNLR